MGWRLTDSMDAFLAAADGHLRADPVVHTVPLTVLATLRQSGPSAFGDGTPVFGWHESAAGRVNGAFFQTPPFPLLVATLPAGSAESLLDLLIARQSLPGAVSVSRQDEASILSAWAGLAGGSGTSRRRSRLFRLGSLRPPDPAPAGAARVAGQADRALLVSWHDAFARETGAGTPENAERTVADRLSHHGFMLWETDGMPVAMAGQTREVAGVVRVSAVYTPPEHRRRGYGGGVTAAASLAAQDAGADAVVLFTDLANPTSNALYQRLGYRPVGDLVELDLATTDDARPETPGPDVTGEAGAPS